MPRPKKETHLFFEQGEDEIQIRSWDKDLNAAVRKLKDAGCEVYFEKEYIQNGGNA